MKFFNDWIELEKKQMNWWMMVLQCWFGISIYVNKKSRERVGTPFPHPQINFPLPRYAVFLEPSINFWNCLPVMSTVNLFTIQIVNYVKASTFNSRLFALFYEELIWRSQSSSVWSFIDYSIFLLTILS